MLMRCIVSLSPVSNRFMVAPVAFSMWTMIERAIKGKGRRGARQESEHRCFHSGRGEGLRDARRNRIDCHHEFGGRHQSEEQEGKQLDTRTQ